MSTLTIHIECKNAALSDDEPEQRNLELVRILKRITAEIDSGNLHYKAVSLDRKQPLWDINGNRVGYYQISCWFQDWLTIL